MESSSPRRAYRPVLVGLAFLVAGVLPAGAFLLYTLGSSDRWNPVEWDARSPLELSIDRATLSPAGDHLLWVDVSTGCLCSYDLRNAGRVACLDPGNSPAVAPIGVVGGDLLALRTRFQRNFLQRVADGLQKLTGRRSLRERDTEAIPLGTKRTTFLERIEIDTGKVIAKSTGMTARVALEDLDPTGFEMGSVSLSPEGKYLAWWKAVEESQGNPLSATVTETFDLLALDPGFSPLLSWKQPTWGHLLVRSALLRRMGHSVWIDPQTCLFLSFLNNGSLVPVDAAARSPLATFPIAAVVAKLGEVDPQVLYGPESFFVYAPETGSNPEVVFWARQEDSTHFFHFDSSLQFLRETRVATRGFHFANPVWLARSQSLLVEDHSRNRLTALLPSGETGGSFPLPPDWEEGFQVLGEDSSGAVIGTNRRVFLQTRIDSPEWEVINFF